MILDEEILVPLYGKNIKHYESLGYIIPRKQAKDSHKNRWIVPKGTKIKVKVLDLPIGSNEEVHCVCDYCGKEFNRMYCLVVKSRKDGNSNDSCGNEKCIQLRKQETEMIKYGSASQIDICKHNRSRLGRFLKYDIDYYIEHFKDHNKTLCVDLIDDCNNIQTKDKLPYICDFHKNAGVQYISYDNLGNSIHCCKYGAVETSGDKLRKANIKDAKVLCDKRNYTLLTTNIYSVDDPIEYICNNHSGYGVQRTTLYGMTHYDCNCKLCAMEKISGENHWNWNGGINDENDTIRKSWEYKEWRQAVYQRDHYTCQCCGKTINEIMINAHHILNFSDHKDLRFDINNGITLCEECHSSTYPGSFHSIYGLRNNTKDQLDEYIKNKRKNLIIQN